MSEIKLRDVLHLYIGCEVEFVGKNERLDGRMADLFRNGYVTLKPILRPLSDMDEPTLKELFEMCYESVYTHKPEGASIQIVQHGGDLGLKATEDVLGKEWTYGLTVNGGGVLFSANGNYLTVPVFEATRILLSRHFDLFNLIESSQAISSPALKGEKE